MKLVCAPPGSASPEPACDLAVDLYAQPQAAGRACAGEAARTTILRSRFLCDQRAWDLLSIALSVVTADLAVSRRHSPDGWTREIVLHIAVGDPALWNHHADDLGATLRFLTTDRWFLNFHPGGALANVPNQPDFPSEDSVVLLSGGLDSLVGAIDIAANDRSPIAVSQVVRGNADAQNRFAASIGNGLRHLSLTHASRSPGYREPSQRARSLGFIAFGVLAATALARYHEGERIPLYVCENGFIALNPPLTGARIGSLTTRTAHPEFLGRIQRVLDAAGVRVQLTNPYAARTKGEMLQACADQPLLRAEAPNSTSCGRFLRLGYRQCGRCVPCQIRRASFLAWGVSDTTDYLYGPIGNPGSDYSAFDDVRSVALALATVDSHGVRPWIGNAVSSPFIANRPALLSMVERGTAELRAFHQTLGVS